jgi:hypothetical protein
VGFQSGLDRWTSPPSAPAASTPSSRRVVQYETVAYVIVDQGGDGTRLHPSRSTATVNPGDYVF